MINATSLRLQAIFPVVLTFALCGLAGTSHATPILISGTGNVASFTGSFDYMPSPGDEDVAGSVTVTLKNTTDSFYSGYITAFAFNLPGGNFVFTGVNLATVTLVDLNNLPLIPEFDLIGGPSFSDDVNGAPFGRFDVGASTGPSFEGGNPTGAIPNGGMGTFTFDLTGTGLTGLTAQDFLSTLSVPPGAGEGLQPFVVRFQSLREVFPDSEKVPIDNPVPEPATALLLSLGLAGLAARRAAGRGPRA